MTDSNLSCSICIQVLSLVFCPDHLLDLFYGFVYKWAGLFLAFFTFNAASPGNGYCQTYGQLFNYLFQFCDVIPLIISFEFILDERSCLTGPSLAPSVTTVHLINTGSIPHDDQREMLQRSRKCGNIVPATCEMSKRESQSKSISTPAPVAALNQPSGQHPSELSRLPAIQSPLLPRLLSRISFPPSPVPFPTP